MKSIKYYIYNKVDWIKYKIEIIKIVRDFLLNKICFKIEISKIKKSPTHPMQEYYWSVIIEMVKEHYKKQGDNLDIEETHRDILKNLKGNDIHIHLKDKTKFYKKIYMPEKKDFVKIYKSISYEGDIKEVLEYFELIKQWCAENLDLIIPDPNKNWRNEEKN